LKSSEVLLSRKTPCHFPDLPHGSSTESGSMFPFTQTLSLTPRDKILYCGGFSDDNKCYELDVEQGRWTHHSLLGENISVSISVSMPDGNYLFGFNSTNYTISSSYLPRDSNKWETGPVVPVNDEMHIVGCGVKISPDEFALIGGSDISGDTTTRIVKYNTRTKTWSELGNLVIGRTGHGCTLVENNIIVAGGHGNEGRSTEVISVETGISRLVGDMHEERWGVALVTVGDGESQRVMAIGGEYGYRTPQSSVEIFNTTTETWSLAPFSMEEARSLMGYLTVTDNVCG